MSIQGDPEKLAVEIVSKLIESFQKTLDQAYNDAINMLDDGYKKIKIELEESLTETYNKAMDEIKSADAIKYTEVKLEISRLKNKIITEAIEKAKEKIAELKEEERYRILKDLFKNFLENTKVTKGEIHVMKRDVKIVKKVLSELSENKEREKNFKITGDLDAKLGGFKFVSTKEKVSYDYTLDLLFENMKPKLMSLASKELFGGVE